MKRIGFAEIALRETIQATAQVTLNRLKRTGPDTGALRLLGIATRKIEEALMIRAHNARTLETYWPDDN